MTSPSALTRTLFASVGGVGAAVGSALCCVGPLAAVVLGVSGAGLAATFEPLRPYFIAATVVLLGGGWFMLNREERRACVPGSLCASPRARRWMRRSLWAATILSVPLLTFSWWLPFLLPTG